MSIRGSTELPSQMQKFNPFGANQMNKDVHLHSFHAFSGSSNIVKKSPRVSLGSRMKFDAMMESDDSEETVTFRRKSIQRNAKNLFDTCPIPDMILQMILENLNKVDLCSAMRTCRRFYSSGNQCKAWRTTDLADKRINEFTLAALQERKVFALRLADTKPDATLEIPDRRYLNIYNSTVRLQMLDISRSILEPRHLLLLLKPCQSIKFLSLESQKLSDQIMLCVSQNQNLLRLDLSLTTGLTHSGVLMLTNRCRRLEELNLSWCGLNQAMLDVFSSSLTPNVSKLNLSGTAKLRGLNDDLMAKLATSCPNLLDLDVSDNCDLSDRTIETIEEKLKALNTLSCNRCYGIDPNSYIKLNSSNIKYLNVHGCITEANIELFRQVVNRPQVNKQYFSTIAKPNGSYSCYMWSQYMSK